MYRHFQTAFTGATGLPVWLVAPGELDQPQGPQNDGGGAWISPFGERLAGSTEQSKSAALLRSLAGITQTEVPVRSGGEVIAMLKTADVLLEWPTTRRFNELTRKLRKAGFSVDAAQLEEAFLTVRVLAPEQHEAHIRLLTIFAGHLEAAANELMLREGDSESPALRKARAYILQHYRKPISLTKVADAVAMNSTYFSEKFHVETGIRFVEFLARLRVEKARHLLDNPTMRVTEVALQVGFQSVSQFNRAFRHYTGRSPTEYRAGLPRSAW